MVEKFDIFATQLTVPWWNSPCNLEVHYTGEEGWGATKYFRLWEISSLKISSNDISSPGHKLSRTLAPTTLAFADISSNDISFRRH